MDGVLVYNRLVVSFMMHHVVSVPTADLLRFELRGILAIGAQSKTPMQNWFGENDSNIFEWRTLWTPETTTPKMKIYKDSTSAKFIMEF
mmetsp:Transcript_9676/g.19749  ORF Transcript_9676/g.19749 Transcript_9676/m.19749 type:complete len:89 (-) Transcript_9676:504-770(-)